MLERHVRVGVCVLVWMSITLMGSTLGDFMRFATLMKYVALHVGSK